MTIGRFLEQIEEEPQLLINFTNFLAKEMHEESERIRKNTTGDGQIEE